jgi:hypothetical protein
MGCASNALSVILFASYISSRRNSFASSSSIASYSLFHPRTFPLYYDSHRWLFKVLAVTDTDVAASSSHRTTSSFVRSSIRSPALNFKMSLSMDFSLFSASAILHPNKKLFLTLFHNVRFPQVIYHGGLAPQCHICFSSPISHSIHLFRYSRDPHFIACHIRMDRFQS